MVNADVEAIRLRLISPLNEAEGLERMGKGLVGRDLELSKSLVQTALHVNREVRELYHLLPEELRPLKMPRFQMKRGESPLDASDGRGGRPPTSGGKLPREVRWPTWSVGQILELVVEHKTRTGNWPKKTGGRVRDDSTDTWTGIDIVLKNGNRGVPGGTTLARLLWDHFGVVPIHGRPLLVLEEIVDWAREYHADLAEWPTWRSGPVKGRPGESWRYIDKSLRRGGRGLPGVTSLAQRLADRVGAPLPPTPSPPTETMILGWADAAHARCGTYPRKASGEIPEAPGETWALASSKAVGQRSFLPRSGETMACR